MNVPCPKLLWLVAAIALSGGACKAQPTIPENDYRLVKTKLQPSKKDVSAIRSWLELNLDPSADPTTMLSPECREFADDVSASVWAYDGSITSEQVEKKWAQRFDVSNPWDHFFENGNCGWASRKLAGCEYLGELNGGDWFLLTIKGGCGEDDYAQTLKRVVKVVSQNGKRQITNLVNP